MAWHRNPETIPKIAICVPHTGSVSMEWTHLSYGPLVFEPAGWCLKKAFLLRGPPIDVSRDHLVHQALNYGADYIFFLDSDITFQSPRHPHEALYRLYQRNLPIVTGLYRAKKKGHPWDMWKFKSKDEGFEPINEWKHPLVEVDVTGMGCALIKREVFENVPKPWFKWESSHAPSEDFFFYLRARAKCGYKTIVDTTIRCNHIGSTKIVATDDLTFENIKI